MTRHTAVLLVLLATQVVSAQAPAPVLSETNRLQLQNKLLKFELAQIKASAAIKEFEDAQREFTRMAASLKLEGWTLDMKTFTYVKEVKEVKEKK